MGITVDSGEVPGGKACDRRHPYRIIIIIVIIIIIIIIIINWNHWNSNEKLKEKFGTVPGKNSIDSLQKTAILGISLIIRKVLQCEA